MSAQLAAVLASRERSLPPAEPARRRDFIVEAPAKMLKRNKLFSKDARTLHLTLRALADGKTGELRKGDDWYTGQEIDIEAEMCRDRRIPAMKELKAAGLVSWKRERVVRTIKGRRRAVRGRTQYTVYAFPVAVDQKRVLEIRAESPFLLQSISSTVEKIDSQVFSKTPETAKTEKAFSHPPLCGKVEKASHRNDA